MWCVGEERGALEREEQKRGEGGQRCGKKIACAVLDLRMQRGVPRRGFGGPIGAHRVRGVSTVWLCARDRGVGRVSPARERGDARALQRQQKTAEWPESAVSLSLHTPPPRAPFALSLSRARVAKLTCKCPAASSPPFWPAWRLWPAPWPPRPPRRGGCHFLGGPAPRRPPPGGRLQSPLPAAPASPTCSSPWAAGGVGPPPACPRSLTWGRR